jgi:hypothetical protein
LGGTQNRSVRVQKILPPPGFDPRTVQPVESRYTDYAIPVHLPSLTFRNTIISLNRAIGLDLHAKIIS